jgi:hypothetical protein
MRHSRFQGLRIMGRSSTIFFLKKISKKFFKGIMSRDFLLLVYHESVSLEPLIIPLGPFRIFSKIRGDFRSSGLPPVSFSPVANLPPMSLTPVAGINDTGGKFATGINNASETGGKICRRSR